MPPIGPTLDDFLFDLGNHSPRTVRAYRTALVRFLAVLQDNGVTLTDQITEQAAAWYLDSINHLAPKTQRLYLTAVIQFYRYLVEKDLSPTNLTRLAGEVTRRAPRLRSQLPVFSMENIDRLISYANDLKAAPAETDTARMIDLRDRALILTLADTGLRIHEACSLRRGDIDHDSGQAVIIGKGGKQAVIRFSTRALAAIRDYLLERTPQLDGKVGRQLSSLPLFARHDRAAGHFVKPISTTTGEAIIENRVKACLGPDAVGTITPHKLRHRFVTKVLQATGNLKLAQELARHSNMATTQLYAHLTDRDLDLGYSRVFEDD